MSLPIQGIRGPRDTVDQEGGRPVGMDIRIFKGLSSRIYLFNDIQVGANQLPRSMLEISPRRFIHPSLTGRRRGGWGGTNKRRMESHLYSSRVDVQEHVAQLPVQRVLLVPVPPPPVAAHPEAQPERRPGQERAHERVEDLPRGVELLHGADDDGEARLLGEAVVPREGGEAPEQGEEGQRRG